MKVTFILPCVGKKSDGTYVRSWVMEPLAIAGLAALTPPTWQRAFFDDRLEPIDYEQPTDLVAISIETFTARRGYQIAREFRRRGALVVFGGYHATLCPEDAQPHGDAVCVGDAERVWPRILQDAETRSLRARYEGDRTCALSGIRADRSIFAGKRYLPITLVETGRGCPFRCEFCSISAFYGARYRRRPVGDIVEELKSVGARKVFFVDDNFVGDLSSTRELLVALAPLRIQWVSQASLQAASSPGLIRDLRRSGCVGLLIGFESLDARNLDAMGKSCNRVDGYRHILAELRRSGISVYGTFVMGYPHDTPELVSRTVEFADETKMFMAAFNHLIPFPGTPLFEQLAAAGRLDCDPWWLNEGYRFGDVPFAPAAMSAHALASGCHEARRRFYSMGSILHRSLDIQANCRGLAKTATFFGLNLLLRKEVGRKRGIPLGEPETADTAPAGSVA